MVLRSSTCLFVLHHLSSTCVALPVKKANGCSRHIYTLTAINVTRLCFHPFKLVVWLWWSWKHIHHSMKESIKVIIVVARIWKSGECSELSTVEIIIKTINSNADEYLSLFVVTHKSIIISVQFSLWSSETLCQAIRLLRRCVIVIVCRLLFTVSDMVVIVTVHLFILFCLYI